MVTAHASALVTERTGLAPSPTMDRELLNTVREADGTPRRSAMFAPEAKDAVAPDDVFVHRRP